MVLLGMGYMKLNIKNIFWDIVIIALIISSIFILELLAITKILGWIIILSIFFFWGIILKKYIQDR